MSYKKVIQLRGLKDKTTKRYFVNIRFYHRGKFLFQEKFDVHNLITERGWTKIHFSESMELWKVLFDIYTGKYPLPSQEFDRATYHENLPDKNWLVKEEDGYSICLKDEDLAKLRQKRIDSLYID